MTLLEFAKKYYYFYDLVEGRERIHELQPFQIDYFTNIQDNKYIISMKSRQMYFSSMIATYCAWFLLFNEHEDGNDIELCAVFSKYFHSADNILDKIKSILCYYSSVNNITLNLKVDNSKVITTTYGNSVKLMGSAIPTGYQRIKIAVFEEAAHIDNLERILYSLKFQSFTSILNKIIINSSPRIITNYFHTLFFTKGDLYLKLKYNYKLNKYRTEEWAEHMRKVLSEVDFRYEIDLNIPEKQPVSIANKDKTISFRLDPETSDLLGNRLIQKDSSISKYIRSLILNDLKSSSI